MSFLNRIRVGGWQTWSESPTTFYLALDFVILASITYYPRGLRGNSSASFLCSNCIAPYRNLSFFVILLSLFQLNVSHWSAILAGRAKESSSSLLLQRATASTASLFKSATFLANVLSKIHFLWVISVKSDHNNHISHLYQIFQKLSEAIF